VLYSVLFGTTPQSRFAKDFLHLPFGGCAHVVSVISYKNLLSVLKLRPKIHSEARPD